MIVKCEQCQTKFKIPDDKVTEKGVKVRCTKCGNTFRVTKDGQAVGTGQFPAAAPTQQAPVHQPLAARPAAAEADPFAKFGVAPEPPNSEATRPGVYALGVEASKVPHLDMSQASTTRAPAYSPGPPRPPPKPAPAKPSSVSQPFDFANFAPTVPEMPAPPAARPATGFATQGTQPHAPHGPNSGQFAQASPQATMPMGPSPFDFGGLGPPPPGPGPSEAQTFVPTQAPAALNSGGFDFSSLVPQTGGGGGEGFDFGSLPPPPPGPQAPPPPPPSSAPPMQQPDPGFAAAGAANPVADLLGDLPPLDLDMTGSPGAPSPQSSAPMGEDVDFADGPGGAQNTSDSRAAFFDMPAQPATTQMPAAEVPSLDEPNSQVSTKPIGRVPLAKLQLQSAPPKRTARRRTVMGILVNIVLAIVLVGALLAVGAISLNDGVVDSGLFTVDRLKAVTGPQAQYVAVDISNGLYDTKAGRPVFFVRGDVLNRGTLGTRLKVRAELLDGDQLVRAAEVIAGAVPTLEELHAVASAEELTQLLEKRSRAAPPVAAGASQGFIVAFFEYPTDLKSFRVRVSVSRDAEATSRK